MVPAADGMAQEFPGWHIWRSQAGRWWATRLGKVAWDQHHDPGFAMTVDADTPAELAMVLACQPHVPADPVRRPRPPPGPATPTAPRSGVPDRPPVRRP